jgi:dsRNA-specific ribonuclease
MKDEESVKQQQQQQESKTYYAYAVRFNRELMTKQAHTPYELHTFCILSIIKLYTPEFKVSRRSNHEITATLIPMCRVVIQRNEMKQVLDYHNFFMVDLTKDRALTWKLTVDQIFDEWSNIPTSSHMIVLPVLTRLNCMEMVQDVYYNHRDKHIAIENEVLNLSQFSELIKLDPNYIYPTETVTINSLFTKEFEKYKSEYPNGANQIRQIFRKYKYRVNLESVLETDLELKRAIEVAENLSKSLLTSIVVTTYNLNPYNIECIDFYSDLMTDFVTSDTTYYELYKRKHNIIIKDLDQPMLRADAAHEVIHDKISDWIKSGISPVKLYLQRMYNQLPEMNSSTDEANISAKNSACLLIPELCVFSNLGHGVCSYAIYMFRILHFVKHTTEHYDKLSILEAKIGYKFTNKILLRQAVTHRAYSAEFEVPRSNNERLEFLGDSVLEIIVSHYLFETFKVSSEGKLTSSRTHMVKNNYLEKIGKILGVKEYLLYPIHQNLKSKDAHRFSADTVEAIIGAIFLDGDLTAAVNFCAQFIMEEVQNEFSEFRDYHTNRFHSFEIPFVYNYPLDIYQKQLISDFEARIGIRFHNPYLILQALTHNSYNTWNPNGTDSFAFKNRRYVFNYERLEFLGDCVLKFIVGSYLFLNYPDADESKMTLSRHNIVDNDVSLANAGDQLGFSKFIRHSLQMFTSGTPAYKSVVSDAFESVLGAIYLDQGGLYLVDTKNNEREYDVFGQFIHKFLIADRKELANPDVVQKPYKNSLQELLSILCNASPVYVHDDSIYNVDTSMFFTIAVYVNKTKLAIGEGHTRKEGETDAARRAYDLVTRIISDRVNDAAMNDNPMNITDFELLVQKYIQQKDTLANSSLENLRRQDLARITVGFELNYPEPDASTDNLETEQELKELLKQYHINEQTEMNVPVNQEEDDLVENILTLPSIDSVFQKILFSGTRRATTRILVLLNCLSVEDLQDDSVYNEIWEDIETESKKYGRVLSITIPRPSTNWKSGQTLEPGVTKIFIEYISTSQAARAQKAIAGKRFQGRIVLTSHYNEEDYLNKVYT